MKTKWIVAIAVSMLAPCMAHAQTALCDDGTYSYSQTRSGTCAWHGGVNYWINPPVEGYSAPSYVPRPVFSNGEQTANGVKYCYYGYNHEYVLRVNEWAMCPFQVNVP